MATYVTDVLTATAATTAGSPTPTRTWQWLRGSTTISGATTNSYTVTAEDIGQPVTARQTETNFLGTTSATGVADGSVLPFAPTALFALNEPGVWYDPSDISTLYTDNVGTTPVTAPGQTVGLMLDKSKGRQQALPLTGWVKNSGDGVVTITDNVVTITGATTTTRVDVTSAGWQIGDFITMTVNSSIGSATGAATYMGVGSPFVLQAGVGTYSALSTGTLLRLQIATGSATFTVTARSRTPGNHATQTTLGQRPTYGVVPKGGRRNLLEQTEVFSNTYWSETGQMTFTSGVADPFGGNNATTVTATGGGSYVRRLFNSPNSSTRVSSIYVRRRTGTGRISLYNVGALTVTDISTQGTWQRFEINGTYSVAMYYGLVVWTTGDQIDIFAPQFELGSTATPYQRVGTTFDVTEADVPSVGYLAFDTDKWMVTNTITPGTDKVQVFAGLKKLSDAATGMLMEFSTDAVSNNGAFYLTVPELATYSYLMRSKGTVSAIAGANLAPFSGPMANVLSTRGDISGDFTAMRVNGTQVSQSTGDQGTGNFLAYPLYIGRRSGSTLPFNGRIYSLIVRFGSNLGTARISATELWVGDKTAEVDIPKSISPIIYTRSGDTILDRSNLIIERRAL